MSGARQSVECNITRGKYTGVEQYDLVVQRACKRGCAQPVPQTPSPAALGESAWMLSLQLTTSTHNP